MKSCPSVVVLGILPMLLSACCSDAQPRFWKIRDAVGGGTAYTVDTGAVPTSTLLPRDIRYVDSAGQYVKVQNPKLVREMKEVEWKQATSGAGYSLYPCPHRHGCWAKTKAR